MIPSSQQIVEGTSIKQSDLDEALAKALQDEEEEQKLDTAREQALREAMQEPSYVAPQSQYLDQLVQDYMPEVQQQDQDLLADQ